MGAVCGEWLVCTEPASESGRYNFLRVGTIGATLRYSFVAGIVRDSRSSGISGNGQLNLSLVTVSGVDCVKLAGQIQRRKTGTTMSCPYLKREVAVMTLAELMA